MSTVKIWGGLPDQRLALHKHLSGARWEEVQLAELTRPHAEDDVWLVHVEAKPEYSRALAASNGPSRSVLWVPEGSPPLPFDEWWEDFSVQLLESRPEDAALLERVARCPQVLDWAERVSDVPANWFASLSGSPRQLAADRLPFSDEDRRHFRQCEDCRAQAYDLLQQQAEIYWTASCPDAAEVGEWLEGADMFSFVQAHAAGCGLCRETVRQQARLWTEEGLLSAEEAYAKLASIGLTARSFSERAAPFLKALLTWKDAAASSAGELAALLTQGLSGGMTLRTATRSATSPAERPALSLEDLADRLEWGEPITYAGGERWLHVTLDGDDVLIRVGNSPAARFKTFFVEFLRGEEVVLAVESMESVARITPDHFATAQQAGADRVELLKAVATAEDQQL